MQVVRVLWGKDTDPGPVIRLDHNREGSVYHNLQCRRTPSRTLEIITVRLVPAAIHHAHDWYGKETLKQRSSVHRLLLLCKTFVSRYFMGTTRISAGPWVQFALPTKSRPAQ